MRYTSIMYHKIEEPTTTKSSVTPANYKAQIEEIKRKGIRPWMLNASADNYADKCFITFDDGHKSNYKAAELLIENGLCGCFYVVKDFALNYKEYLNKNEIKAIANMGNFIGIHGKYHEWWTKYDDKTLSADILEVKHWIEDLTGKAVLTCSAPGGVINNRVIECIRKNIPDMPYIRTSKWGTNTEYDTILNCVAINRNYDIKTFRKVVEYNQVHYVVGRVKYDIKEVIKPLYHFIKR